MPEQEENNSQSVILKIPKCQNDTLEFTLEEFSVLKMIIEDPSIKQNELVNKTGKSLNTVKRIIDSLREKECIRRVNGKRYGKCEVLINIPVE